MQLKGSIIVVLLAMLVLQAGPLSRCALACGGNGNGGDLDSEEISTKGGSGAGRGPSIWNIDPVLVERLTDVGVAGGTVTLDGDRFEGRMRGIFYEFGGERGTGMSFEEWAKTSRASKARRQLFLEWAADFQAGWGIEDTMLTIGWTAAEWADSAGRGAHAVLNFVPILGPGAYVGLASSRAFADAYSKALSKGKSQSEAIEAGMNYAITKGVAAAIAKKILGNPAKTTWKTVTKNLNPRVRSVARAGSNFIVTTCLMTGKNVVKELGHAGGQAVLNASRNQAPQPRGIRPALTP
jgi:hypothetical protein